MTTGTLFGVGVGPGDPELITLKGYRLLQECPVISFPAKKMGGESYAQKIINSHVKEEGKELLGLYFPMTRDQEVLEKEWGNTVSILSEKLREGKDVVFITEGDPFLYSTFIHLMRKMNEHYPEIPVHVVPGISSINGAAARLGLPLADGDEVFAIVPATEDKDEMKQALLHHDAVVFIKVAKVIDQMVDLLTELDLIGKAAVVTRVTSEEEKIFRDVAALKGTKLDYLSLMVVRK